MIRVSRVVGPAVLLVVAFAALLAALAFGGGAEVPAAINPGQLVLWGLPIANLLVILSISGLVGSLLLAIFAFSPEQAEYVRALDVASASSAVLTVSAALTAFLNMQAVDPEPVTFDGAFGTTLANFLTGNALGQAWLWTTIVGAVATVAFFLVRNQTVVGILTIGAVLSLIPMALQGHAGDTASHDAATTSIYLHIVFAAIWLGGLLTLLLCRRQLDGGRLVVVLSRYSTIALICFVVVGISGVVGADVRIGTWENLLTPYGILVLVKVFALGALGIFGIFQRRFLIARIGGAVTGAARYFWFFVAGELAFMGLASGTAVALSRTVDPENPLPASQLDNPTAAELLTGSHLPAPPTIERYLTGLNPDLVWVLIVGFGVFFYLAGVWRLHKRGDSWPVHRTVLWLLGMLVLLYVTCGGVNVYEKFLFSAHMIAHMVLTMAIPVFLVPSAPVTLALRTINKRDDGSRGAREWILLLVQSKLFGFLSRPLVAAILFASSLWIFYYTPLFSWASTDHVGHEWMIFHFLIVGYLFVSSLIGVDPSPHRVAYPMRLLILLATMAFHAFFGLALITSTGLLSADWYGAMGWGPSIPAIQDQQLAGGIAWSIGEIPTLSLAIIVAIMWSRSDARESKRYDRKAERDNDAELNAYNEMLARRARQG